MSILEIAEELRKIAEKKAKETGLTVQEVWSDSIKELDDFLEKKKKNNNKKLKSQLLFFFKYNTYYSTNYI